MLCQDIDVVTFFFFPFLLDLGFDDDDGLLITELSTISITSLMSWVLADEMTLITLITNEPDTDYYLLTEGFKVG